VYFEDLSPYSYTIPPNIPDGVDIGRYANAVNVGSLADGYTFEKGSSPRKLRSKLRNLAKDAKNSAWGFHECDICASSWRRAAQGNGEIHVVGSDGVMYIAPTLIVHYIAAHKHLPPAAFIDTVLES
jgi:hypothetical protein